MLRAALVGYQQELEEIDRAIAALRKRIGGRGAASAPAETRSSGRRKMSAAARKRIAAAQKKRWAEYRKKHK